MIPNHARKGFIELEKRIAATILIDEDERILLQLRDNNPQIGHPNHWGLFGGKIEENETPRTAAIREIGEELGIIVESKGFHFLGEYNELPNKTHYTFCYRGGQELNQVVLMEGQRIGYFFSDELPQREGSLLEGHPLIPVAERSSAAFCTQDISKRM